MVWGVWGGVKKGQRSRVPQKSDTLKIIKELLDTLHPGLLTASPSCVYDGDMTNTNEYGIDTDLIETGDRILISDNELSESLEWATMVRNDKDGFAYVRLDDCNLPKATYFSDEGALEPCYLMYTAHITRHIPVDEVLPGRLDIFPDVATELPEPLAKIIAHLTETHHYLQMVTGKTFEASIEGLALRVTGSYTDNSVTIAFTEKGE